MNNIYNNILYLSIANYKFYIRFTYENGNQSEKNSENNRNEWEKNCIWTNKYNGQGNSLQAKHIQYQQQ
jgi:hypothetical protein